MPEIFRIFGLRFYFYSREHEPMHVHVKSADGKAKFDILPDGIVLVYNIGMKTIKKRQKKLGIAQSTF